MSFKNTSGGQDTEIERAQNVDDHIRNLIDIIEDLDNQITEWKIAAGEGKCDTPEELKRHFHSLPENY